MIQAVECTAQHMGRGERWLELRDSIEQGIHLQKTLPRAKVRLEFISSCKQDSGTAYRLLALVVQREVCDPNKLVHSRLEGNRNLANQGCALRLVCWLRLRCRRELSWRRKSWEAHAFDIGLSAARAFAVDIFDRRNFPFRVLHAACLHDESLHRPRVSVLLANLGRNEKSCAPAYTSTCVMG